MHKSNSIFGFQWHGWGFKRGQRKKLMSGALPVQGVPILLPFSQRREPIHGFARPQPELVAPGLGRCREEQFATEDREPMHMRLDDSIEVNLSAETFGASLGRQRLGLALFPAILRGYSSGC